MQAIEDLDFRVPMLYIVVCTGTVSDTLAGWLLTRADHASIPAGMQVLVLSREQADQFLLSDNIEALRALPA